MVLGLLSAEVPNALGLHCLNHNLQLIVQEAASVNPLIRDAMSTVQIICNLIKSSPKRLAIFKAVQDSNKVQSSLKPLCPTRWTCRAKAVESVLDNYENLIEAIQTVNMEGGSGEGVKSAPGLLKNMFDFNVFYGLHLSKDIFSATELLAAGLQKKDISAGDAMKIKDVLKESLNGMRENSDDLFSYVVKQGDKFGIDPPALPRWRRIPRRLDDGSENTRFTTPEQYFRVQHVEVIDLILNKIEERFDQSTLKHLRFSLTLKIRYWLQHLGRNLPCQISQNPN